MKPGTQGRFIGFLVVVLVQGTVRGADGPGTDWFVSPATDEVTRLRFVPASLHDEPVKTGFDEATNLYDDYPGATQPQRRESSILVVHSEPVTSPSPSDVVVTEHTVADSSGICPDTCDCGDVCANLCPCRYGYVEGLIFWRDNGSRNQPLVLDQNSGDTLLSTGDLDLGVAGGVRAVVGKRLCSGYTMEVGYFGLFGGSASARVTGNNDLQLPGDLGLFVNNFFGADVVDVHYQSTINSVEANLLCCSDCCNRRCDGSTRCHEWAPFLGFRYFNLSEDFAISSTDFQESTTDYKVFTRNNLMGAQLGGRYRVWRGGWSWEATGKAGIFGNAAEQSSPAIVDFLDVVRRPARSETGGSVAFVGELNLTGIYHINDVWGLRTGYNLLWIEGVALAPDQLDFTNSPDSGTRLDTSGGLFLHGVSVGLEARW